MYPIICAYLHYISPLVLSQCLFTSDAPLTIPLDSDIGDVGVPEWVRNEMHSQRAGQHRGGLVCTCLQWTNQSSPSSHPFPRLGYISLIRRCHLELILSIIISNPLIWKKCTSLFNRLLCRFPESLLICQKTKVDSEKIKIQVPKLTFNIKLTKEKKGGRGFVWLPFSFFLNFYFGVLDFWMEMVCLSLVAI